MDIISKLSESFGSSIIKTVEPDGILKVTVKSEAVIEMLKYLKEQLNFNFLTDLCGIHYPDQ